MNRSPPFVTTTTCCPPTPPRRGTDSPPATKHRPAAAATTTRFGTASQSVTIHNEQFTNGIVQANLTYTHDDGSQSTETRSFTLVRQDGIFKIAASQVISG
jgi:hypothetical protein